MVPSDYKLDYVTVRLIERLEGSRRSYSGRPGALEPAVRRIIGEQVERAIGELYELWPGREADAQAALLRQESIESFLPRYLRLARGLNQEEANGYGLGQLASTLGRVLTAGGAVLLALVLARFLYNPLVWLLFALVLAVPLLPELLRWLAYRRYAAELQELTRDMARIQSESEAWLPTERLSEHGARTAETEPQRTT